MPKKGSWTDALFRPPRAKVSRRISPDFANQRDCSYCGRHMDRRGPLELRPTRDHAIPRSRGFSLLANKIICCHDCNQKKRDRTLLEWLAALARSRDPLDRIRVRRLNLLVEEWQRKGLKLDDGEEAVITTY